MSRTPWVLEAAGLRRFASTHHRFEVVDEHREGIRSPNAVGDGQIDFETVSAEELCRRSLLSAEIPMGPHRLDGLVHVFVAVVPGEECHIDRPRVVAVD